MGKDKDILESRVKAARPVSNCGANTVRNVLVVSIARFHWTVAALRVHRFRDGSATERELLARHHSLSTEVQVLLASLGGLLGTW